MNVRLTVFLLVVLALISGAVYVVRIQPRTAEEPEKRPYFYKVNPDDITRVEISHQGRTARFVKASDGVWTFADSGRQVDYKRWSGITFLLGGPRAESILMEQVDDPSRYGLADPRTVIVVGLADGRTFEFHLGDYTATGRHQYAMVSGSPQLFLIVADWGQVLERLVNEPPILYVYDIRPQDVESLELKLPDASVTYEKDKESDTWYLKDSDGNQVPLDEDRFQELFQNALKVQAYRDRLYPTGREPKRSEIGLDPPDLHIIVGLKTGAVVELELGKVEDGNQWAYLPADQPRYYLVPTEWVQKVKELALNPPVAAQASLPQG